MLIRIKTGYREELLRNMLKTHAEKVSNMNLNLCSVMAYKSLTKFLLREIKNIEDELINVISEEDGNRSNEPLQNL